MSYRYRPGSMDHAVREDAREATPSEARWSRIQTETARRMRPEIKAYVAANRATLLTDAGAESYDAWAAARRSEIEAIVAAEAAK